MSYQTQIASLKVENPSYPFVIDNFALGLKLTGSDKSSYMSLVEQSTAGVWMKLRPDGCVGAVVEEGSRFDTFDLSLNFQQGQPAGQGQAGSWRLNDKPAGNIRRLLAT